MWRRGRNSLTRPLARAYQLDAHPPQALTELGDRQVLCTRVSGILLSLNLDDLDLALRHLSLKLQVADFKVTHAAQASPSHEAFGRGTVRS